MNILIFNKLKYHMNVYMSRNIHTLQELNKNKSTNNQRNTQYNREIQ